MKPPVLDWYRMLSYFLIEKHHISYFLLLSGEIDVTGCTVMEHIDASKKVLRGFSGNMWWASSAFISTLPDLPYTHDHNDVENWIFLANESVPSTYTRLSV